MKQVSSILANARGKASVAACVVMLWAVGCAEMIRQTDRDVAAAIEQRQRTAVGQGFPVRVTEPKTLPSPGKAAYTYAPNPVTGGIPAGFEPAATQPASTRPGAAEALASTTSAATSVPAPIFTLADSLAYAQRHQRAYQTAKEDLYVTTLALTLERHLWTPQFAGELRTVYGNYGQDQHFDQAMRFVADLGVTQRMPYGGTFTAQMISTLIRDVKKSLTAQEGSQAVLGLNVPFLRNAGHVAQEQLIQLERNLTYAVRVFERYRRAQLVDVASAYFRLLSAKQRVKDTETSLERLQSDFERVRALEQMGMGAKIETRRAEQAMLQAENRLEVQRESFRAETDRFKLRIGMPIAETIGMENLDDIEEIERQVESGVFPLLQPPMAVGDERLAEEVAVQNRLDLLNVRDQIDDAKRGVRVAENQLLPDLGLNTTLTYDTDPAHYTLGALEQGRGQWRSEMVLSLPLERMKERNAYRMALIDVHRAERADQELLESIRAEVRSAVNQIRLADRTLQIQRRAIEVADMRRDLAALLLEGGKLEYRDKVEAEDEWTNARNSLNDAKTERWNALLQFRLATETLRVEEPEAEADSPAPPG